MLRVRMIAKKINVNTEITYCNEHNLSYLADKLNITNDRRAQLFGSSPTWKS